MSNLKFYNMRSCNDDYVPEFRVSRSTCEPNEIEKKKYTNENIEYINNYPEANIKFRETVRDFQWFPDARFEPDAGLEAIDARMEALYKTETIMMEMTLSEPEDYIRGDLDDEEGDNLDDIYDDNYEEYSLSDRFNEDDDEYCVECHEKKIVAFDFRHANDNLCNDCIDFFSTPVSVDENYVINEEREYEWQYGKDLKLNREVFPWEIPSRDSAIARDSYEEPKPYLCYSRDSAIGRDSDGEPKPYLGQTNDDLPELNEFLKTLSLKTLNEKLHSNHALSMEDYEELDKYSYKTQLSLLDSVTYSSQCHRCGDDMGEKRFKEIYCCDDCEIAVEVYESDCIYANLSKSLCKNEINCKICSRKSNFAFNMRYGVALSEIRIQKVREFAKEHRIKISDAIPRYAELNDCGRDCKLCYK